MNARDRKRLQAALRASAPTVVLTPGDSQVSIAWTDNGAGGAAITAHRVRVDGTAMSPITSASPYVLSGLANGVPVNLTVAAINSYGEGPQSASSVATPAAAGITLSALTLAASSVVENTGAGVTIGGIVGTTVGSTLSLTDSAGGRFAISGTNLVTGSTVTDYETATSHSITIRETLAGATNTPRDTVLTVTVTNVFEQPSLAALSLSPTTATVGTAATIAISGATAGSTLSVSGSLPAGLTLNSAARTITGTPTAATSTPFGIIETLADSANSPRTTSSLAITVTGGITYDTDAAALFARSASAFTDNEKLAYNHAILGLKGLNLWAGLTTFVVVGSDLTKTLLNWKGGADPTISGTVTFTANTSLQGDGASGSKIALGVSVPASDTAYIGFNSTASAANDAVDMGGGNSSIKMKPTAGDAQAVVLGGGQFFTPPSSALGFNLIGKPNATGVSIFNNGGALAGGAGGRTDNAGLIYGLGNATAGTTRPQSAWIVGSGFNGAAGSGISHVYRSFKNAIANPRAASASGKTSGIVANRTYEPTASRSITLPFTFQTCHHASPQANITKIAPIWNGWNRNADVYRNAIGADITIEASVEYPAGSGTFYPLTFAGGATSGVVPNVGVLKADLLAISIPAGAQFRIRTVVTSIALGSSWVPCYSYVLTPNATAYADGSASGNLKTSGTIAASSAKNTTWGPIAIMGELDAPNCRGYVLHGDSVATGIGDTGMGAKGGTGYLQRALDPLYPWVGLTTPGAREGNGTTNNDMDKLMLLAAAMNSLGGVSHVITEGGLNDFGMGSAGAYDVFGYVRAYASLWTGAKLHPCTMTPYSSSTDGWLTAANQTVTTAGSYSAQIAAYNALTRASADTPAVLDIAAITHSATDSGKWKDASPAWTSDGLHPNGVGHAAIAAAITIP